MSEAISKMGHVMVVDSTMGLGDKEYSLCNEFGLLKFNKSAMEECCDKLSKHHALTAKVAELKQALCDIRSVATDVQDGFNLSESDNEIVNIIDCALEAES